ncbi:hypothetical protein Tco_1487507 [Tanacetum coccineum]
MMTVVVWWVSGGGGKRRVRESGSGDRVHRVVGSLFGLAGKITPEKFSGGGATVAGGGEGLAGEEGGRERGLCKGFRLAKTGMAHFLPGRAVIDAAQCKRCKYMTKCADIGYGFLPFSFSSFGELEKDVVTLLKRVRKFSMA